MRRFNSLLLFFSLMGLPAHGYMSTTTTGELVKLGEYEVNLMTQFITNNDSGLNLTSQFDGGINDELNWKAELGFGTTDVHVGGFVKWVPFPDTASQPAIGVMGGLIYGRSELDDDTENEMGIRVHPLVSKKLKTGFGAIIPYASVPVGITTYGDDSFIPVQLVLGADSEFVKLEDWRFMAEVGVELNQSFTYILFGATYALDFGSDSPSRAAATGFQQ